MTLKPDFDMQTLMGLAQALMAASNGDPMALAQAAQACCTIKKKDRSQRIGCDLCCLFMDFVNGQ